MTWSSRGYYYRSERHGRRVRRVYLGRGQAAHLAAALDDLTRFEQAARRAAVEQLQSAETLTRSACESVGTLASASLYAAGYYQHWRGEWRRRRLSPTAECCRPEATPEAAEIADLISRACAGDQDVLPELRALLAGRPELWQEAGDLCVRAELAWAGLAAGPDEALRASIRRRQEGLRAESAGAGATPLVGLLAQRAALARLQADYLDALAAQRAALRQAPDEFLRRLTARAHKRQLLAAKALALVRELLPPPDTQATESRVPFRPGRSRGQAAG